MKTLRQSHERALSRMDNKSRELALTIARFGATPKRQACEKLGYRAVRGSGFDVLASVATMRRPMGQRDERQLSKEGETRVAWNS